jgi:hypothetical protein
VLAQLGARPQRDHGLAQPVDGVGQRAAGSAGVLGGRLAQQIVGQRVQVRGCVGRHPPRPWAVGSPAGEHGAVAPIGWSGFTFRQARPT